MELSQYGGCELLTRTARAKHCISAHSSREGLGGADCCLGICTSHIASILTTHPKHLAITDGRHRRAWVSLVGSTLPTVWETLLGACAPGNPHGCRVGGLRCPPSFGKRRHSLRMLTKAGEHCAQLCTYMCDSSDSCVRVLACLVYFCVFIVSGLWRGR